MSHGHRTIKSPSMQVGLYTLAKQANITLADILDRAGERSALNVRQCATKALVRWCPECNDSHIAGAWCCHHRLCPICQVRRSRQIAASALQAFALLEAGGQLAGTSLHLLTLTQTNVPDGDLSAEIDRLLDALERMRHVRDFRKYVAGIARNIEVTRNYSAHTWHPHVHIILILRDGHPGMDCNAYWSSLWASLLDLSYSPVVDVRPIADTGAVYEVSKYVAKSVELLTRLEARERDDVIMELNRAVHRRYLVSYTGIWRQARRTLKILDDEFVDLDESSDSVCKCGGSLMHAMMTWRGNQYVVDQMESDSNGHAICFDRQG